jgi:lipoprotein-releasing system ATP-binding protein
MSDDLIRTEALCRSFPMGDSRIEVLRGVDLCIRRRERLAILGNSGVGKSTLLHLLGTLDRPSGGRILYEGENLSERDAVGLARFRNESLGFIFQFHHLLPEFSAQENVALPLLMAGTDHEAAMERALELLRSVGLEDRADYRPPKLSGGEQQRVAVARALSNDPALLLADEPSGNLDSATSEELHDLLWELNRSEGQTLIIVTHNQDLAARSPRVLELTGGHLVP